VFDLEIDEETKIELYRTMVRIRTFENRARILIRDGEIPARSGFYTGQEAVAAGVCAHLSPSDQIGSTHRALGHLIAKGCNLNRLMAELCGKSTGLNKGKAGPYHTFDPSVGALGANGIVGGSVPMVAGYALAHQLKGDGGVAISFFGEGASNQGGVQETLNLAACWNLPLVFVCENSSPEIQRMLGHEIDYPQLSIERVSDRANGGPTLLEFNVHQIEGNLEGRLEAREDERVWCPIHLLRERLMEEGTLTRDIDQLIRDEEKASVEEAVSFALRSPNPEPIEAFRDIFAGGP
jgi:pyruvate dehydrogenase E1 component alpha subunit